MYSNNSNKDFDKGHVFPFYIKICYLYSSRTQKRATKKLVCGRRAACYSSFLWDRLKDPFSCIPSKTKYVRKKKVHNLFKK